MWVKEESEKAGLKLNIQKTCHLVQSFHSIYIGKKWKLIDFIFLASKITVDYDCSHKIKRYLLIGRKAMTNLDSILKRKDITLLTKVHIVKAMFFPVVVYRCENWTTKKVEHLRTDAFEFGAVEDS